MILTIGFTKKTARQFFTLLRENGVEVLLDVRISNTSQLAGFAKYPDLPWFLEELCGISPDRVYVKYGETANWGWNGGNF